ncbi:hypothetical protein Q7P35_003634 [Cladosporium inversicolor]
MYPYREGKACPEFSDGGCEEAVVTRGCWKWRSSGLRWEKRFDWIFLDRTAPDGDGVKKALDGRYACRGLDLMGRRAESVVALFVRRCYLATTVQMHGMPRAVHNAHTVETFCSCRVEAAQAEAMNCRVKDGSDDVMQVWKRVVYRIIAQDVLHVVPFSDQALACCSPRTASPLELLALAEPVCRRSTSFFPFLASNPLDRVEAARRPFVHSRPSDRYAAATLSPSPLRANEPVHYSIKPHLTSPHLPVAIHCRPRPHPPSTTTPTYALIARRAVAIALAARLPASGPTSIRFHTASASASILQSIHLLRASAKPPPLAQSQSPYATYETEHMSYCQL